MTALTGSRGYGARVPTVVSNYFTTTGVRELTQHPIVEQVFTPEKGWKTTGYHKRVSLSWVRKLQREGVERVALRCGRRLADFSVTEIMRGGC